ncbi:APC family permease [Aeoliella sp. SH292]|uniref:APC family permease n=1 Tax=Aeoliella sp. SH292 TaxID=3454464 RepID=UPI003F96EE92
MQPLTREIGTLGATMMGLGSIVGTGVFVGIGIAAGVAGPAVVIAIALAAAVATCNALSSAQLAANHPVSGGTYEYGYRWLNPTLGFSAGWMFLCAKSASAATAALGFTGYLLNMTGQESGWLVPVAISVVVVLTAIVLAGVRLSNQVNIVIVSITLFALASFVAVGSGQISTANLAMDFEPASLMNATALMFVAFTGYGRIATLGEEVVEPRRTIPRAIITTLVVSMVLYLAVAVVAIGSLGAPALAAATNQQAAPLEIAARSFPLRIHSLIAIGAMTAMLGVLLNLILGLSRVVLAMGRRGDLPQSTSNLRIAVIVVGLVIGSLVAIGSIKTTWSFSAFTVLIYYAVTNLAAIQLADDERLYRRWWAWAGLIACLALGFAIEPSVWATGLGVLAVGLVWHWIRQSKHRTQRPTGPA